MSSDVFFQLQEELRPVLRSGDAARCEQVVAQRLASMPRSPFHIASDLSIDTSLEGTAAHFDSFFEQESTRYRIGAAYTEMNGFDINPDCWYFNIFAYDHYGGHDGYDWLSRWQSDDFDAVIITGFEPLQAVFNSDAFSSGEFEDAAYVAGLLVVIKFQNFVKAAAPRNEASAISTTCDGARL
jgi:hypothetical protein